MLCVFYAHKHFYESVNGGVPVCIDDEIPFEIPDSWEWVRLSGIASSNIGLTYKPADIKEDGVPVYRSNNIQDSHIDLSNLVRVNCKILENQFLQNGDLLICSRNGSRHLIGKNAIIDSLTEPTSFGAFMAVCRSEYNSWIQTVLNSDYFDGYLDDSNTTAINQITQKMLMNFVLPFPPIEEQKRIVEVVEKRVSILTNLRASRHRYKRILSDTPTSLRQQLIQAAIQGQLVPQDANDEPARILLERIAKERAKHGKKASKPMSRIVRRGSETNPTYHEVFLCGGEEEITDEIPFEIPESWEWVRGVAVFEPMKNERPKSDFHYIDIDAIDNKRHRIKEAKFIEGQNAPSRARRLLKQGDVLFSLVRPYLENIALVEHQFSHAIASTGFYVVRSTALHPQYAYILFLSTYVIGGLNLFMRGDNSPSIKSENIENFLYPLPPKKEQERISARFYELLSQLE